MSTSSQPAERGLTIKLAIVRVTAICSLIYSLLYLFAGFLLFTGALSQADEQIRTAAFVVLAISALPCLFMFLLAFFGFRAARDRLRMLPFCVVACILSAFLIFNMVSAGTASIATALAEGATGVIALAYNALVVVSAVVAVTIVVENRREHGKVLVAAADAADAESAQGAEGALPERPGAGTAATAAADETAGTPANPAADETAAPATPVAPAAPEQPADEPADTGSAE